MRGPFAQTFVEPTRAKQFWPFMSYNRLFLWDYTFYKWAFVSTYNWHLDV